MLDEAAAPSRRGLDPTAIGDALLTRELARQIGELTFEAISPTARTIAGQCVLDNLGVTIAGVDEPAARIVRDTVSDDWGQGTTRLVGTRFSASARDASLANGTAAHALDFDDVSVMMGGHPTATVLPAALSVGEEVAGSGRDLVRSVVAGIECSARVGSALGDSHYARGFHTTATAGCVGAAAAAASMMRLSIAKTGAALGIAATHASGLKSMFGTMSKPLHAGKAAQAGVLAAKLAARGFDSAERALEGEQGLLSVLSEDPNYAELTRPFGKPWAVSDLHFKFHSACYLTHAAIESALTLRSQGLDPTHVDAIEVVVPRGHLSVCAIPEPATGLEGKFSLSYVTALALVVGKARESEFTDALVANPAIVSVRDQVRVTKNDDMPKLSSVVVVHDRTGRRWQASTDVSNSAWKDSPEEQHSALSEKFDALVSSRLGDSRTRELLELLGDLEHLESIAELTALTVPRGQPHSNTQL